MATPIPTATQSKYDADTVVNRPIIVVTAQPMSANGVVARSTTLRTATAIQNPIPTSSASSLIKMLRSLLGIQSIPY